MNTSQSFSCYLIGADTLLIECAEILLKKNHTILGVITNVPRIAQWATNQSITVIPYKKGYIDALKERDFDYLFSITHLAIINDDVLNLASKGSINFHDGPLPAYAGLNAPAWALINQEKHYGISWHKITSGVDQGDILKQSTFEIAENETSISLNTKCFSAALESFPVLVDELASQTITSQPQNFTHRSYYGKFQRPDANGFLQWYKPASEIEAFVRALDFGDYQNKLTLPKIRINNTTFAVTQVSAHHEQYDVSPGKILNINDNSIDVATGEGSIALQKCIDLLGNPISITDIQNKLHLQPGDMFDVLNTTEIEKINTACEQLAHYDDFWITLLLNLQPAEVPFSKNNAIQPTDIKNITRHVIDIPSEINTLTETSTTTAILTAIGILLSRLNGKYEFDIAFVNEALLQYASAATDIINNYSLLTFQLNASSSVIDSFTATSSQVKKACDKITWTKDIIARTPELATNTSLPLGIAIDASDQMVGSILTISISQEGNDVSFLYDNSYLDSKSIEKLEKLLILIIKNMVVDPESNIGTLELLTAEEKNKVFDQWNRTAIKYDDTSCIHHLFEEQVKQTPNEIALIFEDTKVSYSELNNAANQLASTLIDKGIGPDNLVGVNVKRSIDLMIATIAVHKSGAAYVPLDPDFPKNRIEYMINDANLRLIISQEVIKDNLPESAVEVICVDSLSSICSQETHSNSTANVNVEMNANRLAYVIYTSGSTGNPKGVMVEHKNVTNFFVGMDECISNGSKGTWLAATSLSFDISVLELFWTLTRGYTVVIYQENHLGDESSISQKAQSRPMEFGLFMWGNDDAAGSAKYRLLTEGAKYFDQNGFDSVWTPERHFGAFGGPYPNPALTSAALATITKNLKIRTGSLVTPLHHPIRIAEDWAVIDNLSDGRVGLSIAAGWQPNDFVIKPENHKNNKQVMLDQIEIVKKLWRGDKVAFDNPMGDKVEIQTLPRPVQKELPIWFTIAGNPDSYRQAGLLGMNVLTHLLGQNLDELSEKIRIYRDARKEAGFDPSTGKVTLMLHTFVGQCDNEVRELVRKPMKEYLGAAINLVIDFAWTFPAFKRPGGADSKPEDINIKNLTAEEVDTILNFAFDRYFETSGLFGTPETCQKMINRCKNADIDEIGCLLDFGVDTDLVLESLPLLKEVRDEANRIFETYNHQNVSEQSSMDFSLPAQIERHNVTHFQCTPSMARMLCFDAESKKQLSKLTHLMVGGEAISPSLATQLKETVSGRLTNMYGPTETTIWSTTHDIDNPNAIAIGHPIANTTVYILDDNCQPVPLGINGHLYIGGQGVVRGYLNRPDLTKERFISNPFKNDGSRLYWTGDVARYRDDGIIEYVGRIDHQVKIRGYRIELGEIESILHTHENIKECVVTMREDSPGDQRLVAYIITKNNDLQIHDIRDFLSNKLPEYMLPNDVVTLTQMPLTPNGKLNRDKLPQPGNGKVHSTEYKAPEDALQQSIAAVWQETLQLDKVGVNDNFFDLGGHSLLIVRVHQLLKIKVDKPISLTDLYRFPTIKSLTDFLSFDGEDKSLKASTNRASKRRARMGLRKRTA